MYAAAADFPYTCNELLLRGADLTLTNDYDQDAYTLSTTNNSKLGKCYFMSRSHALFDEFIHSVVHKHILGNN